VRGGGGEGKCSACMHVHTYVRTYVCMYVHTCVCQMSRSGGNLVVNVVVRKKELVAECTSEGKRLTHRLQGSRKHDWSVSLQKLCDGHVM